MLPGKTLWSERPTSRYFLYLFIRKSSFLILFTLLFSFLFRSSVTFLWNSYERIVIMVFFGLLAGLFVYSFFFSRTLEYSITHKTITFKGGLLKREMRNIPAGRVTDVTISQTPLERIFGLCTLSIQTAGTPLPEIIFAGLKNCSAPKNLVMNLILKKGAYRDE